MKTGESPRGRADREIFAVAFFPAVIQTQIAYRATPPRPTNLPLSSDWTERHRWPRGGGVWVGVGVGVGDGVPEWLGVGLGLGDELVGVGVGEDDGVGDLLGDGVGEWLGEGVGELGVPVGLDVPVLTGDAWELDGAAVEAVGLAVPADGVGEGVVVAVEADVRGEAVPRAAGLALAAKVAAVSRARTGDEPPAWAAVV